MEVTTELLSLYDYLGHKDDGVLSKKVNKYAIIRKQPFNQRHIQNSGYEGLVFLYSKEFLDEYFQVQKIFTETNNFEDELPF